MSNNAEAFEHWIRTSFVQMNTELEELYFAQEDRARVMGVGDRIKYALRDEGQAYVTALRAEGNTGEGFDSAFGVLGNVGLYMGALRRHELTNPDREERSARSYEHANFEQATHFSVPTFELALNDASIEFPWAFAR